MRVVITGAFGFIGHHLLPLLEEHDVHALSRHPRQSAHATCHTIDLFHPTQTLSLLSTLKPDALIHLAWETTPALYPTASTNLLWLKHSLDLFTAFAHAGGKRIVAAGTCLEYAPTANPCDEEQTAIKPTTLYGAAKASLFQTATPYLAERAISFAWGRIFYPYGPFEKKERLIPQLIASMGERFDVRETTHEKDFIHVKDVARAFHTLLESEESGPFNIGSGKGITLGELGNLVTQVPLKEGERTSLVAKIERLQRLNWHPNIPLQEGLTETIDWWKHATDY